MRKASFKLTLCEWVVSVCCLNSASLDVVFDKFNDYTGNTSFSSFLISVCMFIVSKELLILSDTVIVRSRGAIWLYAPR